MNGISDRRVKMRKILWDSIRRGSEVKLRLDNCPDTFDISNIDKVPLEEIKKSFEITEKLNQ
jgi:hypothetical protein